MSVPTSNLYDFIHQVLEKRYNLAYFYPYGEKRIDCLKVHYDEYDIDVRGNPDHYDNLDPAIQLSKKNNIAFKIFPESIITKYELFEFCPWLVCNDQEPLDYDYYQNNNNHSEFINKHLAKGRCEYEKQHTKNLRWIYPVNFQKKWVLLHSELNSHEVEKYNDSELFECAYWWSHAFISRDWYRFAEYDNMLKPASKIKKLFLMYCRDTTGSRTYRADFLKQTKHLTQIQPSSFRENKNCPTLSAEYNYYDFNSSAFSVVLETVFDNRIHLTEKTLRPIACGHPFIIANGPGTLEYIRSYGFRTFSPWINEDYDLETDNNKRLSMLANELERLENLPNDELETVVQECLKIAEYNKQIFFSKEFYNQVVQELKTNVMSCTVNEINWKHIWEARKFKKKKNSMYYKTHKKELSDCIVKLIWHLKKGGTLENYVPPDSD